MRTLRTTHFITVLTAAVILCSFTSCVESSSSPASTPPEENAAVETLNGGRTLKFSPGSLQLRQISAVTIAEQPVRFGTTAPAHLAVNVVRSEFATANLYLFETQELTQLYSDFVKSASSKERSEKEYDRISDLVNHKAVAEKEFLDAGHEYSAAKAELAEKEGRLRQFGIDPKALNAMPPGTAWALAEVPEGELRDLAKCTGAQLHLSAFPDLSFNASVSSVGDIIDPATRTVKIRLTVANPRQELKPGMFGTVTFEQSSIRAIVVPRNAVVNVQGKSFVFQKIDSTTFIRKEVRISHELADGYVIQSGVRQGDSLVNGGIILLKGLSFGY
jgi:cobalt-zinc-cadmium efflux system membrane fusion protein